jgi:hypothetical protein
VPHQYFGRMGRHVHNVLVRPLLQDLPSELYAVTSMHDNIYDQQVHLAPGKTKHFEGLRATVGFEYSVTFLRKNAVGQPPGHLLIIDDQDRCGRVGESSRQRDLWVQGY